MKKWNTTDNEGLPSSFNHIEVTSGQDPGRTELFFYWRLLGRARRSWDYFAWQKAPKPGALHRKPSQEKLFLQAVIKIQPIKSFSKHQNEDKAVASHKCYTFFQKAYIIHTLAGLIWFKKTTKQVLSAPPEQMLSCKLSIPVPILRERLKIFFIFFIHLKKKEHYGQPGNTCTRQSCNHKQRHFLFQLNSVIQHFTAVNN